MVDHISESALKPRTKHVVEGPNLEISSPTIFFPNKFHHTLFQPRLDVIIRKDLSFPLPIFVLRTLPISVIILTNFKKMECFFKALCALAPAPAPTPAPAYSCTCIGDFRFGPKKTAGWFGPKQRLVGQVRLVL